MTQTSPWDGQLPQSVRQELNSGPLGLYLHIPFCAARCGYCDFNTYTPGELNGPDLHANFVAAARAEIRWAAEILGPDRPPISTVFFGGGTPTELPVSAISGLLRDVETELGVAAQAERSCESNPDSVTPHYLLGLRAAGFNRLSIGMQSAVPEVLATLDRTHRPERVPLAVQWAKDAGLAVSLDLIYGAPGESLDQWRWTVMQALAQEPDHISAYALVVEPGTALAAQIRRGELAQPDDDELATKYELAAELITAAGLTCYEISNWARTPDQECQHNRGYWSGGNWWGIGPGAHSHVGGIRWWNVKHPRAYAQRLAAQQSPAQGREILTPEQRHAERVLLGMRLVQGFAVAELSSAGRRSVHGLVSDGLLVGQAARTGRAVLTQRGRLLADLVVRELLPD